MMEICLLFLLHIWGFAIPLLPTHLCRVHPWKRYTRIRQTNWKKVRSDQPRSWFCPWNCQVSMVFGIWQMSMMSMNAESQSVSMCFLRVTLVRDTTFCVFTTIYFLGCQDMLAANATHEPAKTESWSWCFLARACGSVTISVEVRCFQDLLGACLILWCF